MYNVFAVTYIVFSAQLHSRKGAELQSVLYLWLLSNKISKGLNALLQGNLW